MDSSIAPVDSTTQATPTGPPSSDPTTAGAAASAGQGVTSSTTISSLKDLKAKSPKVYNAMMEGIGMNICNDMKAHQDRLKQMMRDAERDS